MSLLFVYLRVILIQCEGRPDFISCVTTRRPVGASPPPLVRPGWFKLVKGLYNVGADHTTPHIIILHMSVCVYLWKCSIGHMHTLCEILPPHRESHTHTHTHTHTHIHTQTQTQLTQVYTLTCTSTHKHTLTQSPPPPK